MADTAIQWVKLGVRVHPFVTSGQALLSPWDHGGVVRHGAFQVALFAWLGGPDPDGLAHEMESKYVDRDKTIHNANTNLNTGGIRDRTIDRAFERAIHTVNRSVRRTNFWTVQCRLNQQAYWIPVYYQPDISTADRRVTGFQPNSALGLSTGNVYAWKVRAR